MRPPTIPRARAGRPAHRAPAAHRGAARLLRDARGATIVEFAIVAVPFVALMLAVAVTSLAYFVQETLETAVERAARGIVTGLRPAGHDPARGALDRGFQRFLDEIGQARHGHRQHQRDEGHSDDRKFDDRRTPRIAQQARGAAVRRGRAMRRAPGTGAWDGRRPHAAILPDKSKQKSKL